MSGHVVLLGAGHANLAIVRQARRLQRHGIRLMSLVSRVWR